MHEYIAVTLFILYIDGNIYLWYSVIVEEGTQLCRRPAHSINAAADLRSGYFIAPALCMSKLDTIGPLPCLSIFL